MSIVCSLNMIRVDNKYVILSGGKDGKIRLYDSQNGNCEKNITANMAGIVEMIVVKNEEDLNVLSMCNKDKNLVLTNTMNGDNELIDVNE